jgi:arylsulfatase A-like enzyme
MHQSHVLVVVVDGLRASALGAYGNTTFATPALDRFAAKSLLFDAFYAPGVQLNEIYRALWESRHPLQPGRLADTAFQLPTQLHERGIESILISDDDAVLGLPGSDNFSRKMLVQPPVANPETIALPSLVYLFSAAAQAIEQANDSDRPSFVWLHARGMYGPWDAPAELQQSLMDEDDPPPIGSCDSPVVERTRSDSDTAFQFACAYAAQVMVLDECWRSLDDAVRRCASGEWLVVLVGARGFPLGEHARIGSVDERLYAEQLHVPLLLRFPDGRGKLLRRPELVSHVDLGRTLVEWIAASAGGRDDLGKTIGESSLLSLADALPREWRQTHIARSTSTQALRTPDWSYRRERDQVELFVRPDDRWEANDVAARCPEETAEMEQLMDQLAAEFAQALR